MRILASAAIVAFGLAAAGPALAGEGGCSWSTQTVKSTTPTTTQTAETPRPVLQDQKGG